MLLVICKSKRLATARADAYRRLGLIAYGASSSEAFREIDLSCHAVLVIHPEMLIEPHDYVRRLRLHSPAPIFALYNNNSNHPYSAVFDGIFELNDSLPQTVQIMRQWSKDRKLHFLGEYQKAGYDANIDEVAVAYFKKYFYLSKTQRRILCVLINAFPNYANTKTIIKYAYAPNKYPELFSIKTHIHNINKTFFERFGKYAIYSVVGRGYVLRSPETMRKYNLTPNALEIEQQDELSLIPY